MTRDAETAAKDECLAALLRCTQLFNEGRHSRIPAMLYAIRIAMDRLRQDGATDAHLLPLQALLQGLDHLNHGKCVDWLQPRKNAPPHPDTAEGAFVVRQAQALVVAELVYWGLGGKRGFRRQAQKRAAEILVRHGFTTRARRPVTENVLRLWRDDLMNGGDEFLLLRDVYDNYMRHIPENASLEAALSVADDFARAAAAHPLFHLS